ncbi:MAG: hypothetical protein ACK6D3_01205 [Planctomycetaceae bacterium]|jgi:hypothetical protein
MLFEHWLREPGPRITGSRGLDLWKVQAPGIVRRPEGGWRLFYTAVGPERPFDACQGVLLSAVSEDGLDFTLEPGIRVAPQPHRSELALRVLAPTILPVGEKHWRMYFEGRGTADRPTVIASALSDDQLHWTVEPGVRLRCRDDLHGPRVLREPDGTVRIECVRATQVNCADIASTSVSSVVTAISQDGLQFDWLAGERLRSGSGPLDSAGITAAEVCPPANPGGAWQMVYSAWQQPPAGTVIPVHPSQDPRAVENGLSADFARASIAVDLAGYRSRILLATSADGRTWRRGPVLVEGPGYGCDGMDAIHAEDMTLAELGNGRFRMYYAACDRHGRWQIASAINQRLEL